MECDCPLNLEMIKPSVRNVNEVLIPSSLIYKQHTTTPLLLNYIASLFYMLFRRVERKSLSLFLYVSSTSKLYYIINQMLISRKFAFVMIVTSDMLNTVYVSTSVDIQSAFGDDTASFSF